MGGSVGGKKWASLLGNAARGDVFHVIDTETTGSAPPGSRVIELACVSLRHGEEIGRFDTLIDPGVPVPPFITQLTGIRPAMLIGQPRPAEAYARFADYVAALPGHFVAHNASFDYRFLSHEFALLDLAWPFPGRYCTVSLARHALPALRRHNLDSLITHFGVRVASRHRAMGDVEATAEIFWRMLGMLEPALARAEAAPAVAAAAGLPPAALRELVRAVQRDSRTLAAMLDQHGAIAAFDGEEVVLALPAALVARLDHAKRSLLEGAVRAVFGEQVTVCVEGEVAP